MQRPFAWTTALVVLLAWGRAAAGEPQETPGFARKPAATRNGDAVKVDFAVTRETTVLNKRMLRVRLDFAVSETVAGP